jgi:glutathionylspermidine synthase
MPVRSLDAAARRRLRREAIFDCCKWDVQMEDVCALSPVPIVLRRQAWREVSRLAERLAAETLAAEAELRRWPRLHRRLGLPTRALKELARAARTEPADAGVRVIRFDFHFTTDGWRVSEANTDVPGGYCEAAALTRAVGRWYPDLVPTGDPARALAEGIRRQTLDGAPVALVHATAFTDDRQVMVHLARELKRAGVSAELLSPDHLAWRDGRAFIRANWRQGPAGFVFRFFPAEWLPNLRRGCGWRHFFHGAATPLANPGAALLTQSKRFPLVWADLTTAMPAWRQLLPETRAPEAADWRNDDLWVLKPALGRVGELVGLPGVTGPRQWQEIRRAVSKQPQFWAAQRRFAAVPMETEDGPRYPCVGVYVIDGRVCGAYGRVAKRPLVDQYAQDAAVLLAPEGAAAAPPNP